MQCLHMQELHIMQCLHMQELHSTSKATFYMYFEMVKSHNLKENEPNFLTQECVL